MRKHEEHRRNNVGSCYMYSVLSTKEEVFMTLSDICEGTFQKQSSEVFYVKRCSYAVVTLCNLLHIYFKFYMLEILWWVIFLREMVKHELRVTSCKMS